MGKSSPPPPPEMPPPPAVPQPPKPDPMIGQAAMKAAETGEQYLSWMQDQAAITNAWALEDRDRFKGVFQPLEDRMIADALDYASPERKALAASEAIADVRQQAAIGEQTRNRQMAAMGVNPASGRFAGEARRSGMAGDLAAAGAGNMARRQTEATGQAKMASVVNMGRGMAVNPATSMGLGNQAANAGFAGAMQGYNQQGGLLNQQHGNALNAWATQAGLAQNAWSAQANYGLAQHGAQMDAWAAQQGQMAGIGQGIGAVIGALPFPSSKEKKTANRKAMGVLDAVKSMPVEEWEYKQGQGDGGGQRHVGPYAEDFQRATGLGNGREISVIDAVGVNMGATQELAAQVERLESKIDRMGGKSRTA